MRDAICEATASLMAEIGFSALTMDRVAEAAGVAKGTVYNYFNDKDTLILSVIDRAFTPLKQELDAICEGGGSPRAILVSMSRTLLLGAEQRRAISEVLCRSELTPAVAGGLRDLKRHLWSCFEAVFVRASQEGVLRLDHSDTTALSRLFFLVLHGMLDEHMRHPDDSPPLETDLDALEAVIVNCWFKD